MDGVTRIEPPIAFRRRDGRLGVLRDTDAAALWLDGIYDAILDPHRAEGEASWMARSAQLLVIEQVLSLLSEESASNEEFMSSALRQTCEALVASYREIVPIDTAASQPQ